MSGTMPEFELREILLLDMSTTHDGEHGAEMGFGVKSCAVRADLTHGARLDPGIGPARQLTAPIEPQARLRSRPSYDTPVVRL